MSGRRVLMVVLLGFLNTTILACSASQALPSPQGDQEAMQNLEDIMFYLLTEENPQPSYAQVHTLWSAARDQHLALSPLAEVQVPPGKHLYVFGDIHGQLGDLRYCLLSIEDADEHHSKPIDLLTQLYEGHCALFLGDYVDRGPNSLEVLSLLVALKLRFPEQVVLVRGNHECEAVCAEHGFAAEIRSRYYPAVREITTVIRAKESLFRIAVELFAQLPVAALLQLGSTSYFASHGGPAFENGQPLALSKLQDSTLKIFENVFAQRAPTYFVDLLWSDPGSGENLSSNPRGEGLVSWSRNLTVAACNAYGCLRLLRAHQMQRDGFGRTHLAELGDPDQDKEVWTVFSAANYCGLDNRGAVVKIHGLEGRDYEVLWWKYPAVVAYNPAMRPPQVPPAFID